MTTSYLTHVTTAGERWDQLAYRYYADATAYEQIIAANASLALVLTLPAGLVLSIPMIEQSAQPIEDLPPWLT